MDRRRRRHCFCSPGVIHSSCHGLYSRMYYHLFLQGHHGRQLQVKGHEEAGHRSMGAAVGGYLRRELLMVLHHVFMVAFCFPASVFWRQGKGDYFQGVLFLAELSTPSVCLGKVLIQFDKQHTLLHKVNGALMLLTFFSCRVLLFPYLYYAYGRYASIPVYMVPLVAPWQCNMGAALLMALQFYWFGLICRGALRLFTRKSPPMPTEESDGRPPPDSQPVSQQLEEETHKH
ncbi:TLC domain containing 3Ba isoform X2 [Myripristis murdjan]|uniref:TLC domain containing 3Ba isoform X2 n=1 Tax=Myripristis murdjan TaxID=586833 RepID=UPI00117638B3|nr:ceramide synthase-like isoform X2 [Myripristis murdjan]